MDGLKQHLKNPYLYIFLAAYYGVWLIWNSIKIPSDAPLGIISYLPSIHYNPSNNILRFILAVLIPPLACLIIWLLTNTVRGKIVTNKSYIRGLVVAGLIIGCFSLALMMGVVQGSTNPVNNPKDAYGGNSQYAVLDTFHEGESLGSATSYGQKELKPYKDFVLVHGVFQDPVSTLIGFKVFGHSIGAARAFGVVLLMTTFVLYWLLLLVLFKGSVIRSSAGMAVLAMLLMPAAYLPWLGSHILGVVLPFRDFATIIFLMAAILGFRSTLAKKTGSTMVYSGLVGLLASASYADSIDRALYISTLSILWLAMMFLMSKQFLKRVILPYMFGGLVGVLILGQALKWDFVDFFGYLFTMTRYKEYLDGAIFERPDIGVAIVLVCISSTIVIGGSYLLKALVEEQINRGTLTAKLNKIKDVLSEIVMKWHTEILLFFTALFFLRSAIGRSLPDHFFYSVQWLYLLIAFVLINYLFSTKLKEYRKFVFAITVILFGFVWLSYGLAVRNIDISRNTFPIHVKDKDLVRSDYQDTAHYLQANLKGRQTFVTLTSEASWYYLANKPSPIRYPVIWYAFTASQRQEIADGLANNGDIKYVITNNNWTSNFDYVPNPTRFPEVYKVLTDNFVPYKGIGQQTIWIRK